MKRFSQDAESFRQGSIKRTFRHPPLPLRDRRGMLDAACIRWTDAAFSVLKLARDFSIGPGH
jgi:hypothetical protein